jgi:hypothetical protein
VAYQLEHDQEAMDPRAVVLEGIMGRSYYNDEDFRDPMRKRWEEVKSQLSPKVVETLSHLDEYGVDIEESSDSVMLLKSAGKIPDGLTASFLKSWTDCTNSDIAICLLNFLATPQKVKNTLPVFTANIKEVMKVSLSALGTENGGELYHQVACGEIWHEMTHTYLYNNQIFTDGMDICWDVNDRRPFDSAMFPLKTPIVYFHGDKDFQTPLNMGRYHFDGQSYADKYFVTVKGGGHGAFSFNLSDCSTELWSVIAEIESGIDQKSELSDALDKCSVSTELEFSEASQWAIAGYGNDPIPKPFKFPNPREDKIIEQYPVSYYGYMDEHVLKPKNVCADELYSDLLLSYQETQKLFSNNTLNLKGQPI